MPSLRTSAPLCVLALIGAANLSACSGGSGGGSSSDGRVNLQGAGATFPAPLYQRWFQDLAGQGAARVNYQSVGSGAGVRQFQAGTVDFAASDKPLEAEEAATIKRAEALFVRVRLKAAFAQPIKLVLYEGARSRRFAEANLLLDGLTATAKITAPKSGFEPGSYTLDMVTSGHIVQSLRFHLQP